MRILMKWTLFCCLAFAGISCNQEDDIEIDSYGAILGKWELVKTGVSPDQLSDVSPSGYVEYLNDSAYRFYSYETRDYSYADYSMNDSMLIHYYYAVDLEEIDTVAIRYYYTFEDPNTLLLDVDMLAIFDFSLYKKIK